MTSKKTGHLSLMLRFQTLIKTYLLKDTKHGDIHTTGPGSPFGPYEKKKRNVIFKSMTKTKLPNRKHFCRVCFNTHTNICKFCSATVWIWRKRWKNITWWNCHDSNWLEIDLVLRLLMRKVAQRCIMLFFIILAVYVFSVLLSLVSFCPPA